MTTATNAPETTAVPAVAVEPKAPSKMALARELLNRLKGETIPEGSSLRKEFLKEAIATIGLTKNGAVTYYNNLGNEAKGKPLYIKPAAKPSTIADAEQQATASADPTAGQAEEAAEEKTEEAPAAVAEEAAPVEEDETKAE